MIQVLCTWDGWLTYPTANKWEVSEGALHILRGNKLLATHAKNCWSLVRKVADSSLEHHEKRHLSESVADAIMTLPED